jgi:hypothetical protein
LNARGALSVTDGAAHEHQPVRVIGVMTRTECRASTAAPGRASPCTSTRTARRSWLPVEVRTSWAEFMKMCHERPLPRDETPEDDDVAC